jgi:hypothetical protein
MHQEGFEERAGAAGDRGAGENVNSIKKRKLGFQKNVTMVAKLEFTILLVLIKQA